MAVKKISNDSQANGLGFKAALPVCSESEPGDRGSQPGDGGSQANKKVAEGIAVISL